MRRVGARCVHPPFVYAAFVFQIGDDIVNSDINDISGLSGLTSIAGSLNIINNPNESTLTGLEQITSIHGYINIRNNAILTSIAGVAETPYENIANISIVDNPQLSTCNVAVFCDVMSN